MKQRYGWWSGLGETPSERLRRFHTKSSHEWIKDSKYKNYTILDPDGWDRSNFDESFNEKITRAEFERRLMESTLRILK